MSPIACQFLIDNVDPDGAPHRCGRPAVATWSHPVIGEWQLCAVHDRGARAARERRMWPFDGSPMWEPVESAEAVGAA